MPRQLFLFEFSPIKAILVEVTCKGIRKLSLFNEVPPYEEIDGIGPAQHRNTGSNHTSLLMVRTQLSEYFEGKRSGFSLPLDLKEATNFQKRVWEVLQGIPYGTTMSYAQMARKIGRPEAVRAVGNACGANPVPIIIPCHRVVRSDGTLGGYTSGLDVKKALIEHEKYFASYQSNDQGRKV